MRVVATEAFRAYYQHRAVDLNKGDVVKGSLARALLASRAPVRVADDQPTDAAPDASKAAPARRRTRTPKPKD